MKTPVVLFLKRIAVTIFVATLVLGINSCSDDSVDCGDVEDRLEALYLELLDAQEQGDCDEIENVYNKAIAQFKKGKSCSFVEEMLTQSEQSFEEFIEEFEAERDDDVSNCENI